MEKPVNLVRNSDKRQENLSFVHQEFFSCGVPNRWKMHWSNLYKSHKAKLTYSFTSPFTQYQSQSGVISCLPFWCHLEFRTRSQCWVGCLSPTWMCVRETSNTPMSTRCSWGKYVQQRKADSFHCVPFKFTHWQACFVSSWWGLSGWKWDFFFNHACCSLVAYKWWVSGWKKMDGFGGSI